MAGDWIKMRSNLWNDPRVAKICDLTESSESAVVGGLYWLWSSADQHSEDGVMTGLSLRAIDRKTSIPGFGAALCSIGWLSDHPGGVRITRFEEHNGKSAKRRCSESVRKVSARDADRERTECSTAAEESQQECAPREREEIEKEVNQYSVERGECTPVNPTLAGTVCARLRKAGIASVNPSHPKLLELLKAGATADELGAIAEEPNAKKGFAWVLATAEGRRRDAAAAGTIPQARASPRPQTLHESRAATIAGLTSIGTARPQEQRNERVINGESSVVAA